MSGHVHIIGGGLAGLSAGVFLTQAGRPVSVYEATKQCGGRTRSFYDETLNASIDNGTHLLLSGNRDAMAYLSITGGVEHADISPRAAYDFLDFSDAQEAPTPRAWRFDLGAGKSASGVIWWLLSSHGKPPGYTVAGFASDALRLKMGGGETVHTCLRPTSLLYRTFWEPLCLAALNTKPEEASAGMLWAVLRETVAKGGAFARPVFSKSTLSAMLIEPAVTYISNRGGNVQTQCRIRAITSECGHASTLEFDNGAVVLGEDDDVIVGVPHFAVHSLMEGLNIPTRSRAILNVHFRVAGHVDRPEFVGLVNSPCHWLMHRGSIVSVTISAADDWMAQDAHTIARDLWPNVARWLKRDDDVGAMPDYRVVKEKRATFFPSPGNVMDGWRPQTQTAFDNVFLAGDWVDTGLPATMESAVRSGRMAAEAILKKRV